MQGMIYPPASRLSLRVNLSSWERVKDPMGMLEEVGVGVGVCPSEDELFMIICMDWMKGTEEVF